MKRITTFLICLLMILNLAVPVFAESLTGIYILNNILKESDYKIDDEEIDKLVKRVGYRSAIAELFKEDNGRKMPDNNTIYSYLIENNIVSREYSISVENSKVKLVQNSENLGSNIRRSEFLMGVYKSIYGVIDSRPILFNTTPSRVINGKEQSIYSTSEYKPNGYTGDATSFELDEGDFKFYISPNVYELYLSELLDKGIISLSEIGNSSFKDAYNANGTQGSNGIVYPRWSNNLEPYRPLENKYPTSVSLYPSLPLGDSFIISGDSRTKHSKLPKFEAKRTLPDYFIKEDVYTMDALKLIEKMLRLTEKDLSKAESELVAFKYGTSNLMKLEKQDRTTVNYLIAMGVIDFENPEEYGNLYSPLTREFAYTLMYRLKNKSGRKDFNKIQLTDNDMYWIKNGYLQQDMQLIKDIKARMPYTERVEMLSKEDFKDEISKNETLLSRLSNSESVVAFAQRKPLFNDPPTETLTPSDEEEEESTPTGGSPSSDTNTETKLEGFKVVKVFTDPKTTTYSGKVANDLKKGEPKEVGEITKLDNGFLKIEFLVEAPNSKQALLVVDSKINFKETTVKNMDVMKTITRVEENGTIYAYVTASELKRTNSEISVIADKVLKNKLTGDSAVILDDHNLALVGNKIFHSNADMVMVINGEVYYNMEFVVPLMTNAYLTDLDPARIYFNEDLPKEKIVPVYGSGMQLEKTTVIKSDAVKGVKDVIPNTSMYNYNLITRGVTQLSRDFYIHKEGKPNKATVLIDWAFSMPEGENYVQELTQKTGQDFNVKDASKFLFTRPESGDLQAWWDSNYELSNALANMMYGTRENVYITSGYLRPNITVLVSDNDLDIESLEAQLFHTLVLSPQYLTKYCEGSAKNIPKALFNGGEGDPTKRRTYSVLYSDATGDAKVFDDQYIMLNTGTLYRNFVYDTRVQYNGDKIVINGRTETAATDELGDRFIKFNNKEYFVDGYSDKASGSYRLVSREPVVGKAKKKDKKWTLVDENGKDVITKFVDEVTKDLGTETFVKSKDYKIEDQAIMLSPLNLKDGEYIFQGKLRKVVNGGKMSMKFIDLEEPESGEVKAHPAIYLSKQHFKVNGDEIVKGASHPYLEQGNIFFSGLNSTLISRLLDEEVKTKSFKELPTGSKVIIQDVKYTVTGQGLVSDPIQDQGRLLGVIGALGSAESIRTEILKMFSGLQVDFSGRPTSFTSYLKEATLGPILESHKTDNTLYKDNSNASIIDKDKKSTIYTAGAAVNSYIVNILPDENLRFYLVDENEKMYAVKYTTDYLSPGYIDNVSMFYETLSFGAADDLFLQLEGSKIPVLENVDELIKEFKDAFNSELHSDVKILLKRVAMIVVTLYIVIGHIFYFMLRNNLCKGFLDVIYSESKRHDTKIDLVKYITLFLYNMEDEPKYYKLFVTTVSFMFLLVYIILKL